MAFTRSKTVVWLIASQLASLLSLMLWLSLYSLISRSGVGLDTAGPLFILYPAFPMALSIFAWIAFFLRRYRAAIISSLVPAIVATLLMSYYFVIGLAQHTH